MTNSINGIEEIINRIERLESRMTRMENNVTSLREEISVHLSQALRATENRLIRSMQEEIVSKLEALLRFKETAKP